MPLPDRLANMSDHRFGFNGKEEDNEIHELAGWNYDFGARMYDSRIGRWWATDPCKEKYPGISDYAYVMNTPLSATDPDGNLVLFIGGLILWHGRADQPGPFGWGQTGIYKSDVFKYWSTQGTSGENYSSSGSNSFGFVVNMAERFMARIQDYNAYFTSGSSQWDSQASQREDEGALRAAQFHAMVQSGEIVLACDETIKMSHIAKEVLTQLDLLKL